MILDEHGRPIDTKGPAVAAGLDKKLNVLANQFEGVVDVKIYADAIEGKGHCSHCGGPVEGVLRFPGGYRIVGFPDERERQADAKRQLYDKLRREHYCIPRLDGHKEVTADFIKRIAL